MSRGDPPVFTSVHEPVLGTRLVLRIRAVDEATARAAEGAALAEFDRLEALLSAYRPDSEWSRWRRGEVATPGPEVTALLGLADRWHSASAGAFNPQAGVLRQRWLRAERDQVVPDPGELADLATGLQRLPYRLVDGGVERTGDCSALDLHALAKGWIVDRAAGAAMTAGGVGEIVVNAGGDLFHRGTGEVVVGIEDPRRPFDNVAPMVRVRLSDGGLATGSGARRPVTIGGRRFSHVIDPRSGQPVEHILSASVFAPDAATADAVATVVGVLPVDEGVSFAEALPGVGCCLLAADGTLVRTDVWSAREID